MSDERPTLLARLLEVQRELKAPKGQHNSFGGFDYRSKEDVLEAAKPLCHDRGMLLLCSDEAVEVSEGWVYVRACASVVDAATGERVDARGLAREPEAKKGMDASQITGAAASYAGKRALANLLAIDDTADADAPATRQEAAPLPSGPFTARCRSCGTRYEFADAAQYEAFVAAPGCCPAPAWEVE